MKNIWTIAKKELRSHITSPIASVVVAVFLVLSGFFIASLNRWFNVLSLQVAQTPTYYNQHNINQQVFAPLFHNMSIVLLLIIPLLTMRLFAEEKKIGTEELLFTSPLSVAQIILGKYLASLLVLLGMLILATLPVGFAFLFGNPEVLPFLTGFLGLFLMGAAFIALGIFFSSTTENQIVAAVLTFGSLLLFWIINWASASASGFWKGVLDYVSILQHFDNLTQGILDTTDVVYYLSFVFLGLFLTHAVIQSRRWR
ncbi:MAG: ABC transporter permease subunit [Candidatus Aminicenantes bacterium]|nr:ABC transporter permease subunit [Candidatus Aminicenantes bacterium]